MGFEISDEFWPITPLRTITTARTSRNNKRSNVDVDDKNTIIEDHSVKKLSDDDSAVKYSKEYLEVVVPEEECTTPKSEAQLLQTPLVCPPAPRKPRPVKRKRGLSMQQGQQQQYVLVPSDLNSVFSTMTIPSTKKIKFTAG